MDSVQTFNLRLMARMAGMLMVQLSWLMVIPIVVSLYYHDGAQFDLMLSAVLMLAVGLLFRNILGRTAYYNIRERESFWIVSTCWVLTPLLGALPFILAGGGSVLNALFESFSGFTTTGITMYADLSVVPQGLLVWRAIIQWVGGFGLMMMVIARLQRIGMGASYLYDAEFSGTLQRKLHPHIASSVKRLFTVYCGLTVVLFVLLLLGHNGALTSFGLALATVSTGGFTMSNAGLDALSGGALAVISCFMLLSGINGALIYQFFAGRGRQLWRNEEFRHYVLLFLVAVVLCMLSLLWQGSGAHEAVCYSLFHIASTMSTCGFTLSAAPGLPALAAGLTLLLTLIGTMSSAHGGGIKLKRIMILQRYISNYFTRMIHPNVVFTVRIDRTVVSDDYINKIFAFVFMFVVTLLGGALVLMGCGVAVPTALMMATASITTLGATPLVAAGSAAYIALPALGKITVMVLMTMGRVELFAFLALLSPVYWRRRKAKRLEFTTPTV